MEENLVELDVVHKGHDYKIIVDINNANIILNDPVKGYEIVETFLKTQGYVQQNPSLTCTSGTEIIWAKRRPDDIDTKATEEFLQLRIKYDPLFVNKKQLHSVIFNKIASELTLKGYNLGSDPGKKCVHKFNNLQKTYIAYRNHVNTTGVEYKEPPPFYELLHSLLGNSKPSVPHGHGHSAIKDLAGSLLGCNDENKKDDGELWSNVEAQTAFLGPNLWDKTYETDLKYVDLDEFLSENGVSMDGLGPHGPLVPLGSSHGVPKRERSPSPDCLSPDTMNPPSPADSNEELKPQPIIKKSRKTFVPDDLKDDKYWARRRKNNLAAKRSRDARRMKENQIALRAGYLEKENMGLRQELERLKKENLMLQNKLAKYEDV